ncbi:MAG: hypothetical protein RIC55_33175 [Pirellulaceae bacterium]
MKPDVPLEAIVELEAVDEPASAAGPAELETLVVGLRKQNARLRNMTAGAVLAALAASVFFAVLATRAGWLTTPWSAFDAAPSFPGASLPPQRELVVPAVERPIFRPVVNRKSPGGNVRQLHPLKPVDRTKEEELSGNSQAWRLRPEPIERWAFSPRGLTVPEQLAKAPVQLDFVTSNPPLAVLSAPYKPAYVFDLTTGSQQAQCPLRGNFGGYEPATQRFLDYDSERVDVWSAAEARYVAAWDPYDDDPNKTGAVSWAGWNTAGDVLTLSVAGKLVCFEQGAPRVKYSRQLSPNAVLQLNATRNWGYYADGTSLQFLDVVSGEHLGGVQFGDHRLAWSKLRNDDRLLLAAFSNRDDSYDLHLYDLSDAVVLKRYSPSKKIYTACWMGESNLISSAGVVWDLETAQHVWSFELPAGGHVVDSFGGAVWIRDRERIVPASLDDLSHGPLLKDYADLPQDRALNQGGGFDYEVTWESEEETSGQTADFKEEMLALLSRNRYRHSPGAKDKVRLLITEAKTGEQMGYARDSKMFPNVSARIFGRPDFKMEEVALKGRLEVQLEGRKVWTSPELTVGMPESAKSEHGESPIMSLRRAQRQQLLEKLQHFALPHTIVRWSGRPVALPGASTLEEELK